MNDKICRLVAGDRVQLERFVDMRLALLGEAVLSGDCIAGKDITVDLQMICHALSSKLEACK